MFIRLFAFLFTVSTMVYAQEFRGTISGQITDPTGAVVAGAEISVVNQDTNVAFHTRSNDQGNYQMPFVLPGNYRVVIEHPGFKKMDRGGIRVSLNAQVRLDFALELGAATESVTVSAEAPLLNTMSADLGQVVDKAYIDTVPVNLSRNVLSMATVAAGVLGGGGGYTSNSQATMSIDGGGSTTSRIEVFVDGIPNTIPQSGGNIVFVPSMDSVEEVKVHTTLFDAAYGHSNGGAINITTRAGTNQPHGTLYGFKRYHALDANNWMNDALGLPWNEDSYYQWGFTLIGPVVLPHVYNGRNRTFFSVALERNSDTGPSTRLNRVPTELERQGDFSQTLSALGGPLSIYDPLTTVVSGTKATRQPFPGARIPAARLDPIGSVVLGLYPLPDLPGAPQISGNNWTKTITETTEEKQFSVRLDHNFGTRHRLFARVSFLVRDQIPIRAFPTEYREGGGGDLIHRYFPSTGLDYTFTISPTFIGSIQYGFSRRSEYTSKGAYLIDPSPLKLPAPFLAAQYMHTYPIFRIGENMPMTGGGYRPDANELHSVISTLTKLTGPHSIKFGVDLRIAHRNPTTLGTSAPGDFTVTPVFTQADPYTTSSSQTSGTGMASMLLGAPSSGSIGYTSPLALQNYMFAGFIQEDWKITKRLTINLGVRYELETPYTERYNRVAYAFDSTAALPVQAPGLDLRGGILFAGVDGHSRREGRIDGNNFGPRFGFAWNVAPKTVLRGGYALFYSGQTYNQDLEGAVGAFNANTSYVASIDSNATLFTTIENPFPNGLQKQLGASVGLMAQAGSSLEFSDINRVSPYNQQWQVGVQRELPGQVLAEVAYLGMLSVKELESFNLNEMPDQYLPLGAAQNTAVTNPFLGLFPAYSTLGQGATIPQKDLWLRYPQFTTVTVDGNNTGVSTYNALELRAEKRLSHHLQALWNYNFSRLMHNNITSLINTRHYRSVSSLDQKHVMHLTLNYQLPWGFEGAGWNRRVLRQAFSGWMIGGIATYASGVPLTVTQANGRPLRIHSVALGGSVEGRLGNKRDASGHVLNPYFDITAFTPLANQYTVSPELPYLDELRAPSSKSLNMSLSKSFRIRERLQLGVRADATGVTNTPTFGSPGTNMSSTATFGVITTTSNQRSIMMSARVVF